MDVKIPKINNGNSNEFEIIKDKNSIVLIGANGSGKTRMSVWIENNNECTFRISAQKSLDMPENTYTGDIDIARNELYYGTSNVNNNEKWLVKNCRWKDKQNTILLDDFEQLMRYLFSEDYEKTLKYKKEHKGGNKNFENESILEKMQKLWNEIILHRSIEIRSGKIEVTNPIASEEEKEYSGVELSDGEREIFYFLGEVLAAPKDCIIIIDEPENHLHDLVLNTLWDKLEEVRSDCTFVYITHKIDFAISRVNSQIIWIKEYKNKDMWDYELINDKGVPEELYLTILGSRKNILLVEGEYDYRIYSAIYNDYNVIQVGSCENVINYVKAFKFLENSHYIKVYGIIDKDRRDKETVDSYKEEGIYCLNVNEIENLFVLPEIMSIIAKEMGKSNTEITEIVKESINKVINKFGEQKEKQLLSCVKEEIKKVEQDRLNIKTNSLEEFKTIYEKRKITDEEIQEIYDKYQTQFDNIISSQDLRKILEIYSNKGLLEESGILKSLELTRKAYVNLLIKVLKANTENISDIVKRNINL